MSDSVEFESIELPLRITIELCGQTITLDPLDQDFERGMRALVRRLQAWGFLVREMTRDAAAQGQISAQEHSALNTTALTQRDPMSRAEDEMVEGYRDGRSADNPEPSGNRSRAYRHGFQSGRGYWPEPATP